MSEPSFVSADVNCKIYRIVLKKPENLTKCMKDIAAGHFRVTLIFLFLPLFQNESTCETIHMKMSFTFTTIFMQMKVIFISMVSHVDSF